MCMGCSTALQKSLIHCSQLSGALLADCHWSFSPAAGCFPPSQTAQSRRHSCVRAIKRRPWSRRGTQAVAQSWDRVAARIGWSQPPTEGGYLPALASVPRRCLFRVHLAAPLFASPRRLRRSLIAHRTSPMAYGADQIWVALSLTLVGGLATALGECPAAPAGTCGARPCECMPAACSLGLT